MVSDDPEYLYRLRPIGNDELWRQLRAKGNRQTVKKLFGELEPKQRGVIYSDFLAIRWWAKAMHQMAEQMVELRKTFGADGKADLGSNEFLEARAEFIDSAAEVAKKTDTHFGDPWGLLAMNLLAERTAQRRGTAYVKFTGGVDYERRRPDKQTPSGNAA